jgi:O-antigen/teichoic acid export membrane protein
MSEGSAGRLAGARALRNILVRSAGELASRLMTLAVLAVLARVKGQTDIGLLTAGVSFLVIATTPMELGLDRYLLRQIAADRSTYPRLVGDVLAAKLRLAVVVVPLALVVLFLSGFSAGEKTVTLLLLGGYLLDSVTRTFQHTFVAVERADLIARAGLVQRLVVTGLSLPALAAGYGVKVVATAMTIGAVAGLVYSWRVLRRELGPLDLKARRSGLWALVRRSSGFAVQDVFTALLFRVDAVILTVMTSAATVGRYGAAYRLLESSFFISYSISGAFSPMYTYLTHDGEPSVGAMFSRSVKVALAALTPIAVVFVLRADQTSALFFGGGFGAGGPLSLLGPCVVLIALATLGSSLVVSRGSTRTMVLLSIAATVLNVVLNLVLIPRHGANGAATAMLITEIVLAGASLAVAGRVVKGVAWLRTAAGPLAAGAVMIGAFLVLPGPLLVSLPIATAAYVAALAVVERFVSPEDLRFAIDLVRRRAGAGTP